MTVREGRKVVWFPPQAPEAPESREGEASWGSLTVERFRVPFTRKPAPLKSHASARWLLSPDAAAACDAPQPEPPIADEVRGPKAQHYTA